VIRGSDNSFASFEAFDNAVLSSTDQLARLLTLDTEHIHRRSFILIQ